MTSSKTGLFSAIVGAFIIEFYKKLSSDSGDQTVALLQQISHQLPNSPNNTGTNSNTTNQPSSPGTAMIWVNALWLISLVLSLTCALFATLLQQWARRYIETPKSSDVLRHRARVRSLLLVGTKLYKIPLIVGMLPTLLHLSVYLFLAGLVITFHTIHKKVAIAVDVAVGVSGLAYLALSILPCVDVRCPYRTPISQILWYPYHAFLSFAVPFLDRCILGLRELFNRPAHSSGLSVSHHWQYFTYGLEKSIVRRAVETLKDGDRGRVTRLFNQLALGDRKKFLKFAASIPRNKILDLILPVDSVLLRGSLLALLRISAPGIGEVDVDERALKVCLHAIHHIVKAPIPDSDLEFMWTHFANTYLMRYLWEDDNKTVRVISRCICALLAKQVVRKPLKEPQLRWLGDVLGQNAPNTTGVAKWDRMNLKTFITEVLSDHDDYLPIEDAAFFKETLAILLDVRIEDDFATNFQRRLSAEVQTMRGSVIKKLRSMFPFLPVASTHVTADSASTHEGSTPKTTDSVSPPVTADSASTHAASSLASARAASPAAASLASAPAASPSASSLASARTASPASSSLASAHAPSPAASSLASAESARAAAPAASSLPSARTASPVSSSLASAHAPSPAASSLASAHATSPAASSLASAESARAASPASSSLASAHAPFPAVSSLASAESARAASPAASGLASAHAPSPPASGLASAHAPSPAPSSLASARAASPAASSHAASSHAVLNHGGSTPMTADSASTHAASSLASARAASSVASSHAASSHAVLTHGGSTPVTADSASTCAGSSPVASSHAASVSAVSSSVASSSVASSSVASPPASLHHDPLEQV